MGSVLEKKLSWFSKTSLEKVWNLFLFRLKSVWTLLEMFRLAFQNFFSPLAGLKNRIKTGIGILQESARTWRVFCSVVLGSSLGLDGFLMHMSIWFKLIYLRQTRSCSRILLFCFQKDWKQMRFWLRLLMMIMQFPTMREFRCLNEALLRFSGFKLQNARN